MKEKENHANAVPDYDELGSEQTLHRHFIASDHLKEKMVKSKLRRILKKRLNGRTAVPDALQGAEQLDNNPPIKFTYTFKALQNKNNIENLTWNSVGDKFNYNADGSIVRTSWDTSFGISCCKTGDPSTPGFIVGSYYNLLSDGHGNKNYKAIMVKVENTVTIPPHTKVDLRLIICPNTYKFGGTASSSWMGTLSSNTTSWKSVSIKNNVSGQWATAADSGVLPSQNAVDCTIQAANDENFYFLYALNNHSYGVEDNNTATTREWKVPPVYQVCMIEKANSVNHRLMLHGGNSGLSMGTYLICESTIYYDANGGEMGKTEQYFKYASYSTSPYINLYSVSRPGYIFDGWLDTLTGVRYPAGYRYSDRRGMKLVAQWSSAAPPMPSVPENLRWNGVEDNKERATALWDKADGETSYILRVMQDGKEVIITSDMLPGGTSLLYGGIKTTANSVDLSKAVTTTGNFTFTVAGYDEGTKVTGQPSESPVLMSLDNVKEAKWKDSMTLSWSAVEGADYYVVQLFNDGEPAMLDTTAGTNILKIIDAEQGLFKVIGASEVNNQTLFMNVFGICTYNVLPGSDQHDHYVPINYEPTVSDIRP